MKSPIHAIPSLRDQNYGWLHFVALGYAVGANLVGLFGMHQFAASKTLSSPFAAIGQLLLSILLAAHGKIIGSYLVHEAAHGTIFERSATANEVFGTIALIAAGCPYVNFRHVRKMHICHHKDRADVVEFDYRQFVMKLPDVLQNMILACEFCFFPIVEIIHHLRAALYPILCSSQVAPTRVQSSLVGGTYYFLYSIFLIRMGIFWPHVLSGLLVLHFLVLNDAFHHTYQAVMMADYIPGPADRTAAYEEENTFSNLISTNSQIVNAFALNFGYHNAHHQKPMTPWYSLPSLHDTLYDAKKDPLNFQVLTLPEVFYAWYNHRLRRITEEHYGVVHPVGTPGRANDFVGALGVSFLTV